MPACFKHRWCWLNILLYLCRCFDSTCYVGKVFAARGGLLLQSLNTLRLVTCRMSEGVWRVVFVGLWYVPQQSCACCAARCVYTAYGRAVYSQGL